MNYFGDKPTTDSRYTGGIDWGGQDPDKNIRADELSMLLLGQFGPTLEQALRRYGNSMTPEGKARLAAAFRQRALMNATDTAKSQSSYLRGQGFSRAYDTGLGVNAFNRAQRESTAYSTQIQDPARDVQQSLGVFSALSPASPQPPQQGGSLVGDIANIVGAFF